MIHDCRYWPEICWCQDRDYAEEDDNRRTFLDHATREDRDEVASGPIARHAQHMADQAVAEMERGR